MAGLDKGFPAGGLGRQTPEDEGRFQGDGAEGIDGEPQGAAVRAQGGDHGDARGIAAQGVAETAAVKGRRRAGDGGGGGGVHGVTVGEGWEKAAC